MLNLVKHCRDLRNPQTLCKISTFNKTQFSTTTLSLRETQKQSQQRRYTYIDLVTSCKVASVTLVQALIWMTIEMCYYTIALESSSLGVDMYEAYMLSALAEMPSNFLAIYTCTRYLSVVTSLLSTLVQGIY